MTITDVAKDVETRTLTITARYEAPCERVWQVWADPRLLERWWGPPTYPATVREHDLTPGGRVSYLMTGPEGETYPGWWQVLAVDPPHSLEFEDGFADAEGRPQDGMPVTVCRVSLEPEGTGCRMSITSVFPTAEAMAELEGMGMVEGMQQAMGQIPDLLAG